MTPVYVRDAWYVAAWSHELDASAVISRTILGRPVALYRGEDGSLNALEDRCCHRGLPLSMGEREGDDLRCGYHGFLFAADGACVEIPGKSRIPAGLGVKRYAVAERQSWIWVWLGDAGAADEALIPASWSLADPAWEGRSGQVDYQAYYELINDNLTDLSHLAFVHRKSFGAGPEWASGADGIAEIERGLRIERWIVPEDGKVPPGAPPADNWQSYDYLVPGVLLMRNYFFPMGTAQRVGLEVPLDEAFGMSVSWQAVTPISDTRSRYFFGIAVPAGPGADSIADFVLGMTNAAFEEDRITIEAQQRMIDLTGDDMKLAGHDDGPIRFRRVLARLAHAEAPIEIGGLRKRTAANRR